MHLIVLELPSSRMILVSKKQKSKKQKKTQIEGGGSTFTAVVLFIINRFTTLNNLPKKHIATM